MERRREGFYTTSFERLISEMSSLVSEKPNQVHRIKIERFGGELFGDMYVSGNVQGDVVKIQVDGVQPNALGSFFLAMAQSSGVVHPGGIYEIHHKPKEECNLGFGDIPVDQKNKTGI